MLNGAISYAMLFMISQLVFPDKLNGSKRKDLHRRTPQGPSQLRNMLQDRGCQCEQLLHVSNYLPKIGKPSCVLIPERTMI